VGTIELAGVTRRFGDLTAVDRVTLDVEDGEIVGLLGHNGAGKTTLIRVVNGLLRPDEGEVRVLGVDPVAHGEQVRRSTGVLTAYPALDEFLSTVENLEVYGSICGVPEPELRRRIAWLVERLDLVDKRDVKTRGLSAGLKQRVALARALVHDPQVLLLDEPTTNMDPVAARTVRDLIVDAARRRGRTVLLSTHNLAEAEAICDRVAMMRMGEVLAVGAPGELRRSLGGSRGVRVQVRPGDVELAAAAVPSPARVHTLDDVTIEVTGEHEVDEVVRLLVHAGVAIHRVDPQDPTLEDLYMAMHQQGHRTDPAAGPPPPPAPVTAERGASS
jgi:ABC-2 type transport system ATP-binding protein